MDKKAKKLINKYFDQELSKEEATELIQWINDGNLHIFNQYVMIHFTIDKIEALRQSSTTGLWEDIHNKINKPKKVFKLSWRHVGVAAVIALIVSIPVLFNIPASSNEATAAKATKIIPPGTDKAILTLENGDQITLEKGQKFTNTNVQSNGETLIYNKKKKQETKKGIVFNYLTVPRGGQFYVELSDGTEVWLNSESKLKYPVTFAKSKTRKVELLYGEGYFKVSSSKKHNGAKFTVKTKEQDLIVLGTEFNLKAYKEDENIATTLVEGKVTISNGIAKAILRPGQQATVNKQTDKISTKKVNIAKVIAWKNGYFYFKNESLATIMQRLSRWYNFEVLFINNTKKQLVFSGNLKRNKNIETLLKKIEKAGNVRFKITGKTIQVE